MALNQYALITLEDFYAFAGIEETDREADALRVYCDQGDATDASVKVQNDTMTLEIVGGAEAGSTPIDLSDPLYATLGLLVAYINTLTGWEANLESWTDGTSTDLLEIEETGCLGSDNEQTLKFYDHYIYEQMINRASAIIENFLNRNILSRDYIHEKYDGGGEDLFTRNFPVTRIQRLSIGHIDAIRVRNTADNVYNAYVTVTTTGVILTEEGTSEAEITFAANATLEDIVTAINGVANWEAEITHADRNGWPSDLLFPQYNIFCAGSSYADINVPGEPLEGYEVDAEAGIIHYPSGYRSGFFNVILTYTAGYATTPDAIIHGACRVVKTMDEARTTGTTTKSEKLGDYSYTNVDIEQALNTVEFNELKAYRRLLSGGEAQ
jgi:hypothetical protein